MWVKKEAKKGLISKTKMTSRGIMTFITQSHKSFILFT